VDLISLSCCVNETCFYVVANVAFRFAALFFRQYTVSIAARSSKTNDFPTPIPALAPLGKSSRECSFLIELVGADVGNEFSAVRFAALVELISKAVPGRPELINHFSRSVAKLSGIARNYRKRSRLFGY
jgi:hypothetical protein